MAIFDTRRSVVPTVRPSTVLAWTAVLTLEAALLLTYALAQDATLEAFHVYPFVWLNLGAWAVWRTSPPRASRRRERIAGAVAVGYFLVLGFFGGLYGPGTAFYETATHTPGLSVATTLPPGYGPAILYGGDVLTLAVSPYTLVGYLALTYLVYVTVVDAAGAAASGLLGLLTCVSCSWPILASIATGLVGGTGAFAATVYAQSYGISTVAFVVTVALLYWRPFGR